MQNPELLGDRELHEVEDLVKEYPFFQSGRMLYVKNLRNQGYSNYNKILRENAIFITNRTKLFFLLNARTILNNDADATQQAAEEEVFDFHTLETIAGFKPMQTLAEKAKAELAKLIESNKETQPYFTNLSDDVDLESFKKTFGGGTKKHEQTKEERHAELLAKFTSINIKQHPTDEKQNNTQPETTENIDLASKSSTISTDLLSETLAQIYVKQGAYEKALLMYEKMCLKYPEKKIYFAARIKEIKEIVNN